MNIDTIFACHNVVSARNGCDIKRAHLISRKRHFACSYPEIVVNTSDELKEKGRGQHNPAGPLCFNPDENEV